MPGLQGGSGEEQSGSTPVGTSEDWAVLDSGKSFAWSPQQHETLQQQLEALEKLIQQQGQQVCNTAMPVKCHFLCHLCRKCRHLYSLLAFHRLLFLLFLVVLPAIALHIVHPVHTG